MKKGLKIAVIVVGAIAVVLIGLTIFVRTFLRSEALEPFVLARVEAYTGRKAELGDLRVSLFRSITAKDFRLKEKDGRTDFLRAEELVLRYRFWPILRRQLIIDELQLTAPEVAVSREPGGTYNFSDLQEKLARPGPESPAPDPRDAERAFTVAAERIEIREAGLHFTDRQDLLPEVTALADLDLRLSAQPAGITTSGRVELRSLRAVFPGGEIQASGSLAIGETVSFELEARLGSDRVGLTGSVQDLLARPAAMLDIASQELDLDRLAALGGPPPDGSRVPAGPAPPPRATAAGDVAIEVAKYGGYRIRGLRLSYTYEDGAVQLSQIAGRFADGDKATLSGVFGGGLSFSIGSGTPLRTLSGSARATLDNVRLKENAIVQQASALLAIPGLPAMLYNQSELEVDFEDGKVTLEGFLSSPKLKANPIRGTVDLLDSGVDVAVDLQLSPDLSAQIPGQIRRFLTTQQGWSTIPLAITGTTGAPSVGLDRAVLGSGVRRELGEELQRGLEDLLPGKKPGEQQVREGVELLLEGLLR